MIKVTINFRSETIEKTFKKNAVLIGSGFHIEVDIPLYEQAFYDEHVKIEKEVDGFVVYNLNDDPFVQLNGQLFHRSLIHAGDKLKVGEAEVLIVELAPEEPSYLSDIDMSDSEIDDLLSHVDKLAQEKESFFVRDFMGGGEDEGFSEEEDLEEESLPEEGKDEEALPEDKEGDSDEDLLEGLSFPEEGMDEEVSEMEFPGIEEDIFGEGEVLQEKDFDIDATLNQLFSPSSEEDEDFDIDSIITESEEIEEEKKKELVDSTESRILFDEDEGDLEFIRKEAEDQALDKLGIKKGEEKTEGLSEEEGSLKQEAFEKDVSGEDAEEFEETVDDVEEDFTYEEEEEEEEVQDEIEALFGLKNARQLFVSMAKIGIILFLSMGILTFVFYRFVSGQNDLKETVIAQGIVDLSMAMEHKRIYDPMGPINIASQSFMQNHLSPSMEKEYYALSPLNKGDYFEDYSYQIKVYMDRKRERFLLLAEPTPGILQRLAPKGILFVDSITMNLRRSASNEKWASLLKGKDFLDDISEYDFSSLLSDSDEIDLSALNAGEIGNGFSMPKEIEEVYPGAWNKIYNVPRYYAFGKPFWQKVFQLGEQDESLDDIRSFREALQAALSRLENFIFYFPNGKDEAKKGYEFFHTYAPDFSGVFAYLRFDFESGLIAEAKVLDQADLLEVSSFSERKTISRESLSFELEEEPVLEKGEEIVEGKVFLSEPILEELRKLVSERKINLEKINSKMNRLMEKHAFQEIPNFGKKYLTLFEEYQEADQDYQKKMHEEFSVLYERYGREDSEEYVPDLMERLEGAQLLSYLSDELKEKFQGRFQKEKDEGIPVENYLKKIERATSLEELNMLASKLSNDLSLKIIEKPDLVSYQNRMREIVLQKLNEWMFSFEGIKKQEIFQEKNRKLFDNILRLSNISEEDERNFYLKEFDALLERLYAFPDAKELGKLKEISEKLALYTEYDELLNKGEKEEVRRKHLNTVDDIETQEEFLGGLKEKVLETPVVGMHPIEEEKERESLGRMGQQMLIHAGLQDPSLERDKILEDAIGLLRENLNRDRSLWGGILEARRLMTQTSEKQLVEVLDSGIGFVQEDRSLPLVIKMALTKYFDEKKKLTEIRDEYQLSAQYELFRTKESKRLKDVIQDLEKVQESCNTLKSSINDYEKRLKIFLGDYEKAKLQGFFVKDFQIQSLMAARLGRKIHYTERLNKKISKLTELFIKASRKHGEIAREELAFLEESGSSLREIFQGEAQEAFNVLYPNLAEENLKGRLDKILNIVIAPLQ